MVAGLVVGVADQRALDWVRGYAGSFPFLRDMAAMAVQGRPFSAGQVAAIVRCYEREQARQSRPAPVAPAAQVSSVAARHVQDGTYTVEFVDGTYRTLRLVTLDNDAIQAMFEQAGGRYPRMPHGTQRLQLLVGPDNETSFTSVGWVRPGQPAKLFGRFNQDSVLAAAAHRLQAVDSDTAAMALGYATRSGRCARCGRTLTVPASLHRGYGPDCAAAIGLGQ